jgi:RNA polymerase sigma-70 factor (ECF subfamily)
LTASLHRIELKFEELFRTYFDSLCYFARKYIPDLDSSKEIVHNVFISIWEKREEFDFDKPAKSYLFTSVYNRCMNYIRDQKKFTDSGSAEIILENESVYDDHLEAAELESRIWRIIEGLPEKCREVFVLNRFESKKYAEIADQLNISVKTVEAQMSKALRVLRDNLKDYIHLLILFLIKNLW